MPKAWLRHRDDNNLLWVKIDQPGASVNTFTRAMLDELASLLDEIERDTTLRGVLFSSGKVGNFIAGADIKEMKTLSGPDAARELSRHGQSVFARLASLTVPTVALISGTCLGGGLEFALACRHRVADEGSQTLMGLPETQLGLVPAWGGTVRLPRRVGLTRALAMITAGQQLNGRQAYSAGLVDAVAPADALRIAGHHFIDKPPKRKRRPWWRRWFLENNPGRKLVFAMARKQVQKRTQGHYPAVAKAVDVIEAGMNSQPMGYVAESQAVSELANDPVTRESIRLFFLREAAKEWALEAAPLSKQITIDSVGLLGAGTMGAELAKLMAEKGIEVRLRDLQAGQLASGLKTVRKLLAGDVKRKRKTRHETDKIFRRISPTIQLTGLRSAAMVIEAVVEKMEVKQAVFRELQEVVSPATRLASNTSSLSVTTMADSVDDPGRVVGVHFFNPPTKMPLVEIVRTEKTDEQTLAVAVALVRKLGKTPVIVADCPGFLVNRLLVVYLNEAGYLLTEGVAPETLERAAIAFGFPMGPLELTDLVGAAVSVKVGQQMHLAYGQRMKPAPMWEAYAQWLDKNTKDKPVTFHVRKRFGGTKFNPELTSMIERVAREQTGPRSDQLATEEIAHRLVFPLIDEAARCLDEGIVADADAIDLSMVFGTGFAPFRGGPMRFANQIGIDKVIESLRDWGQQRPRLLPSEALLGFKQDGFPLDPQLSG